MGGADLASTVLVKNDDLPLRVGAPVHSGKVRSVYWLTPADSKRLIAQRGYNVPSDTALAVMVISDRISAFECLWHAEEGLHGVPRKGAALNAIAQKWFDIFAQEGIARHHILEAPHPLVWVVEKTQPVLIEAIVRQYITGSLWRAYARGERTSCGLTLPEGLHENQRLEEPLITPSTKGIMRGLAGVAEADDVNISRQDILRHLAAFKFRTPGDVNRYEELVRRGFAVISKHLARLGQIFVDTKFELGYRTAASGEPELIFIDEVGTPDSSRIWDAAAYSEGRIIERSKEGFRQILLQSVPDPDILLNKNRMSERTALARATLLPAAVMHTVSRTYVEIAEAIVGHALPTVSHPREEILQVLSQDFQLVV